jgi:hypothetical protein
MDLSEVLEMSSDAIRGPSGASLDNNNITTV